MRIGVPKETAERERRVALVPDVVRRLVAAEHEVVVESGAGVESAAFDEAYTEAGATIGDPWGAEVVVKVAPPSEQEAAKLQASTTLVCFLNPLGDPKGLQRIPGTALAMEMIPRISRAQSMDALSSQATVSGYKAVLIAADELDRFFPMFMTAAGTVPPAQVLVLGAGVAGLQAIATARRLGAVVTGFDIRSAVKEQIQSLGAKFFEVEGLGDAEAAGGYARELTPEEQEIQRKALSDQMARSDVIVTTALVPGRPAPKLIPADAVERMKRGSVIVDLAAEAGGNCELARPGETYTTDAGVIVAAPLNVPSTMAEHASSLYARNLLSLLELGFDFEDDVIKGACVVRDGKVVEQMSLLTELAILVLAAFVGFEVISKVPNTLHTPLMSGTNAIHGIVVLGGLVLIGHAHGFLDQFLLVIAIAFGTINVVGGFLVTDRMLEMFKGRKPDPKEKPPGES